MLKLTLQWSKLFVNGKKIIKFKAKDSKTVASPLCLGNICKGWPTDNMKKTEINGYFYEFNVDYKDFNPLNFDKILICQLLISISW